MPWLVPIVCCVDSVIEKSTVITKQKYVGKTGILIYIRFCAFYYVLIKYGALEKIIIFCSKISDISVKTEECYNCQQNMSSLCKSELVCLGLERKTSR